MKIKSLLIIVIALVVCAAVVLCIAFGGKESAPLADKQKPTYTNSDGKTQEELNEDKDNFLGTWVGTSGNAENLYGTIELTINEDNTFDADVTEEIFSGTWEKIDGGIKFESLLLSGEMYFGEKCRMVIYEDDVAPVVLIKKDEL